MQIHPIVPSHQPLADAQRVSSKQRQTLSFRLEDKSDRYLYSPLSSPLPPKVALYHKKDIYDTFYTQKEYQNEYIYVQGGATLQPVEGKFRGSYPVEVEVRYPEGCR